MSDYILINGELYHHGVKGMKWGVRRYQNPDGSLTDAGVKRYAKAGYAKDSYNSNKTVGGKIYDKVTGSHGIHADIKYAKATKEQREARAKQYLNEKHNKNYTDKRRKNDRAFYGNRGEKRINKKLNEGYGLRGARHFEVERQAKREKAAKVAKKGAEKSAKILSKIGMAYLTDQIFYGGTGTKIAKETIKTAGRAAVTAFVMARGGYDIKWYDKQGRRVG